MYFFSIIKTGLVFKVDILFYRMNARFHVSLRVQLTKEINLTFCVLIKEGFELPVQSQTHIVSQRCCDHSGNIFFLI